MPALVKELKGEALGRAAGLGLDRTEAEAALSLVERVAGGSLLRRAAAAPRRWRELPFFFRFEGRLVRGFTDLVFEEDGALVVVDYKTDSVAGDEVEARAEVYLPQGAACALGAEAASGKEVREVVFSFLRTGVDVVFPMDDSLRERASLAVRRAE